MTTHTNTQVNGAGSIARLMSDRFNARIAFDAPDPANTPPAPTPPAPPAPTPPVPPANQPSDAEAKLLKEVMKLKADAAAAAERLRAFEGIDPEQHKALKAEKEKQEQEAREAEKKALEAKGEFERLKAMMADEHKKEIDALKSANETALSELKKAAATINDLTVGQKFATSKFIKEELVLTPQKARVVYGQHFEIEGGKEVAYDKPVGAAERTKLVDGSGNPLDFEAAIKKLVDADPEKDSLLRSKLAPGAGSKTENDVKTTQAQPAGLKGAARMEQILATRRAK